MSNKFPTNVRLVSKSQFNQVFTQGKKSSSSCFSLFYCDNDQQFSRIGIVATKKNLPTAVMRNRFKRIVRESFRSMYTTSTKDTKDLVVFAYKGAATASNSDLRKWLSICLAKFI